MYLQKLIYNKSCERRSWGLVAFITTLMGCSESIFVDKRLSIIDFPIFLLFFNTKFPIFSILNFLFSYFFEQPCCWTPWRILAAFPFSNLKFVAEAFEKVVAFKTANKLFISNSNSEELHVYQFANKPNHKLINKAVLYEKLKGAKGSELVKCRVPSTWFLWKSKAPENKS